MRVLILSRNKNLHSIRRLIHESKKLHVECDVINPLDCQLILEGRQRKILVHGKELPHYDAVLPRIGTSITDYGLAVVRHFETMGIFVVNGSHAIADSRNKLRSLQTLSEAGLRVPNTVLCRGSKGLRNALETVKEMPVVLKALKGTQGLGVMLIHSVVSLVSVLDTFQTLDEDVLLQEFLKESEGSDYRLFVVGGTVIAAMQRTAPKGEFRSNIHRGGEGSPIKVPASYLKLAVRAAQVFNLGVAGVDLMIGPNGPTILEVNSSPGFEGIEKATHKNIAHLILKHTVSEARKGILKERRKKLKTLSKRKSKKKSKKRKK